MYIQFYIRFVAEWHGIRNIRGRHQQVYIHLDSVANTCKPQTLQTQPNVCFHIYLETCKAFILNTATVLMKFFLQNLDEEKLNSIKAHLLTQEC